MRDYKAEFDKRVAFIRDLLEKSGCDGIVYGNSGGKDSALVGILCKFACENTVGILMERVPEGFSLVAHSDACPNVGICDEARGFYGVQYHPEVNHTEHGFDMVAAIMDGMKEEPDAI